MPVTMGCYWIAVSISITSNDPSNEAVLRIEVPGSHNRKAIRVRRHPAQATWMMKNASVWTLYLCHRMNSQRTFP